MRIKENRTGQRRGGPIDAGEAEALAVRALAFIAGDERLLPRFLALSGIAPEEVRRAAGEPGSLAGVLGFLAAHEPDLIAFAQSEAVAPEVVARAYRVLAPEEGL